MSKKIPLFETSEPYEGIARHILLEDSPEDGEVIMIYDRDVAAKSFVIAKKGEIPSLPLEHDRVVVPSIGIGSGNSINRTDSKTCQYDLESRGDFRAKDSIKRQEDVEALKTINASIDRHHTVETNGEFLPKHLFVAMSMIDSHELTPKNIVLHPLRFAEMQSWNHPQFVKSKTKSRSLRGTFDGINIYCSSMCPKNAIYVLPDPKYIGVFIDFSEIEESLQAEDNKNQDQNTYRKEIGVAVLNSYATSRVIVTDASDVVSVDWSSYAQTEAFIIKHQEKIKKILNVYESKTCEATEKDVDDVNKSSNITVLS